MVVFRTMIHCMDYIICHMETLSSNRQLYAFHYLSLSPSLCLSPSQLHSFHSIATCVLDINDINSFFSIDEEKNHPSLKEEKLSFVHQASIVHATNNYSIH